MLVHRLALRRTEPGAADVSGEHAARGSDSRLEVVRPGRSICRRSTGSQALWHLPVQDIIKNVDGPRGIFESAMPVETGGRMIQRAPNDPAWYRGGLYHDDQKLNVPGLWFMSWYDVSVRPEPRALQPRAQDGVAGGRERAVGDRRAGRALRLHRAPPPTPSSASAAWATRASTTARSPTGSSTGS
mgnify:CR=1 FL=1